MLFPEGLEWNQPGVEPTQTKKNEGWLPEEKPPAEYFNWFFNRLCLATLFLNENKVSKGEEAAPNAWRANQNYTIGDICYPKAEASFKYMECTVAGTSAATEPAWGGVGTTISDGTATWKVCDIRQGTNIGRIPALVDVGGGKVGLPAVSGKLLTDISGMPIGSCLPFLANSAPSGWLACDTGALVSRATYPDLWTWVQANAPLITESAWQAQAAVQSSVGYYSSGDGSTTFRLPRLVDFVRGSDGTRLPGTWQEDDFKSHKHLLTIQINGGTTGGASNTGASAPNGTPNTYSAATGGTETRPKSITMLYCVKAFDAPTNQGMVDITALANEVADKINLADFIGTNQSKTANGWQKFPGGLILQWGYYSGTLDDLTALVNFPIAFPNVCLNVEGTADGPQSSAGYFVTIGAVKVSASQFRINGYGNAVLTNGYHWFAIGY